MFEPYTIGRVFGVPVRVHGLLLVLLGGLLLTGAARGAPVVLPVAAVVVALLAHELGHAFAARRLGVQVVDIVLGPIVSKANLVGLPEDAGIEARIAVAGPLMNLALAGLAYAAFVALGGGDALTLDPADGWGSPLDLLRVFVLMNLLLGTVNLLPAFPMDGGRLLRAALVASGRSWLPATELAVRVGKYLAVAMLVLGFMRSLVFVAIALFVLVAGARELLLVRLRHGAPLFGGGPGGGPAGGPGAGLGGPFGGVFDLGAFLRGRAAARADAPGQGFEPGAEPGLGAPPEARRTERAQVGPDPGSPAGPGSGYSDEDVKKLESYRGRLRRGLDEI